MAHARKQIRDAVKNLVTGLTTTGTNVFVDRDVANRPMQTSSLPRLLIGTVGDQVDQRSFGDQVTAHNRTMMHTLTLSIYAETAATSAVDDALDLICSEVETALFSDPLLSGMATDMRLVNTDYTLDEGGAERAGMARMDIEVDYWSVEGAPDTITS